MSSIIFPTTGVGILLTFAANELSASRGSREMASGLILLNGLLRLRSCQQHTIICYRLSRALCRIKLLPVTHILVDTLMLTVKPVYKLSNVPDDLKWATNTHDTIYTHFQDITNNIYGFGRSFCSFIFFYPSTNISTRPYSLLPIQMKGGRVST